MPFLFFNSANASDGDKQLSNAAIASKKKACVSTASAASSFQSNIFQVASGRVTLIVMKQDAEPVLINIFDGDNQLIFKEKIKEDSVKQNFNMKNLDPGDYRFTISRNGECFTKTVTVK